MKTLILSKYKGKNNVQDNLTDLVKRYGRVFHIKYKTHLIPVELYKFQYKTSKKSKFFRLKFKQSKKKTYLNPFLVNFNSIDNSKYNQDCYIAEIHKTDKLSGTLILHFLLDLLNKLNIRNVSIVDNTQVNCDKDNMDLSLNKLLTHGISFYERFGFKFSIFKDENYKRLFDNDENLRKILKEEIIKFKKIKISKIKILLNKIISLLTEIIEKNDFDKVDIIYYNFMDNFKYEELSNLQDTILSLLEKSINILNILNDSKEIMFYKSLDYLFNHHCNTYIYLKNNLLDNNGIQFIKYKRKEINYFYKDSYELINLIRYATLTLSLKK